VLFTLSLCGFGCGEDPILTAAEAMVEPTPTLVQEGQPTPGTPDEPLPGQPQVTGEAEEPTAAVPEEPTAAVPEEPTPGIPEEPEPAAPGAVDRPKPPPGAEGVAVEPEPGIPDAPKPAPPGSPGGAEHKGKEAGQVETGPQVILRGHVTGEGISGKIRIDLFDGDQRNVAGPRPKVVGVHDMPAPGAFELSVPVSADRVWIGAYQDANSNKRPDKGEPSGWYSRNPVHMDNVPDDIGIV